MAGADSGGTGRRHYGRAVVLALALSGCVVPQASAPASDSVAATSRGSTLKPEKSRFPLGTAFGVDLYKALATRPGNLSISPVSLTGALAPVTLGARGETRSAMQAVLHLADPAAVGDTLRSLERGGAGATLSVASALWVQRDFALKPDFVAAARDKFGADAGNVDFMGAPDAAVRTINDWVSTRTRARIPALIGRDAITDRTQLVVTNAVYFLADWRTPFRAGDTSAQSFFVGGSTPADVPLMYRKGQLRYTADDTVAAIDLPYKDESLSMTVLLPKARDGLPALERALTAESLTGRLELLDAAVPRDVYVHLPRFEASADYALAEPLTSLGMGIAFTDKADLTGIADADLRIAQVFHKTFVTVDEKGTEAAAATGVTIEDVSAPAVAPPTFRADHPFLYVIRDKRTGVLLFIGRVVDPR